MFNPYLQKEAIIQILEEYKRKKFLNKEQYDQAYQELDDMNFIDFYELSENLKTPIEMTFETKYLTKEDLKNNYIYTGDYSKVEDKEYYNFYYDMMQFGFLKYLEPGNLLRPKRKRFEFLLKKEIKSETLSLLNDSIQENISNSDSGDFVTFKRKENEIIAYVCDEKIIKLANISDKKVLKTIKKHDAKIVCIFYFLLKDEQDNSNNTTEYLISLSLDNKMIITDISENEDKKDIKPINKIGDTFEKNKKGKDNTFSISAVRHNKSFWIITSYYYDKYFKIYDLSGKSKNVKKSEDVEGENIISLQSIFYSEQNAFICVRTPTRINIFINEFFVHEIILKENNQESSYINFKIIRNNINSIYLIISSIEKDLSKYSVLIYNLTPIFPYFTRPILFNNKKFFRLTYGDLINKEIFTQMNEDMQKKIQKKIVDSKGEIPLKINEINQDFTENKEKKNNIIKKMNSGDIEKFNIGNILFWDNNYLIVGTPFDYLHIFDFRNKKKVGTIYNNVTSNDRDNSYNIAYNISDVINDPEYGNFFIIRDSKGTIQYLRHAKESDVLNYKIIQKEDYFNELPDKEKLLHIKFSTIFYFFYWVIFYFIPLLFASDGHSEEKKEIEKIDYQPYYDALYFYIVYAVLGVWLKGFVYNVNDETHTSRTLTRGVMITFIVIKFILNCSLANRFCIDNKTGIILIGVLNVIYFAQFLFHLFIYCTEQAYLLKTYWLAFLFYQISRLCIIIFFILSIITKTKHFETYIYAAILCFISLYNFIAQYYSTFKKEMLYDISDYTYQCNYIDIIGCCCKNCCPCCKCFHCCYRPPHEDFYKELITYIQAMFNYPFEWINIFCSFGSCPSSKECIKDLDNNFCCCDPYLLIILNYLAQIVLIFIEIILYIFSLFCCSLTDD